MIKGLTSAQVSEKTSEGKINKTEKNITTVSTILRRHLLTVFNFLNLALAVLILIFGEKRNALFAIIAIISTLIGITNDLRAKRAVDKLSLLSKKDILVIRDGEEAEISPDKLVEGDILKLVPGDQIPVDSELKEGILEVNESFLTGESDNAKKISGDKLSSGSFVVSGTCFAKVLKVGNENSIQKTLNSSKEIKDRRSELFRTLNKVIKINSIIIIPVGILLFLNQNSLEGATISSAITSTVAAIVAMIPEGLILLTSSVLALASIRLSKKKVLISNIYSVETLARVDTICFDKTGTLTTGNMHVEKLIPVKKHTEQEMREILKTLNGHLDNFNPTSTALNEKFGADSSEKVDEVYQFSSDRKFSGVKIKKNSFLIGAFSSVTKNKKFKKQAEELEENYRVLTLVKKTKKRDDILGFVLLSDEVRKSAKQLLKFFMRNDVDIKIISGDAEGTILKVLKTLGLKNLKSTDLSKNSDLDFEDLAEEYSVFARVTPDQKRELVKSLRESGHTVAMTGDGINDILAMKEADCGIALGSGTSATRQIAEIVTLDNDFSVIPAVINEGRQTINNITRSSTLFLNKTIFATILSVFFIFLNIQYPFSPIEMSLINIIIIGIPSFVLALETNHSRIKETFLERVIRDSLPAAISIIISILTLSFLSSFLHFTWEETLTCSFFVTVTIGLLLVRKISKPFNTLRGVLFFSLIALAALAFYLPISKSFFSFSELSLEELPILLGLEALSFLLFSIFSKIYGRITRSLSKNQLSQSV